MKKLNGIFPPIPTPFINGELAVEKLSHNFLKWNNYSLAGYAALGSNGEAQFLTKQEKLLLVEEVKNNIPEEKILITGTGSDSIRETIELTNQVAELGSDFALILTPSFYKSEMNSDAIIRYFSEIADKVKIPILIYNVPKYTGIDIDIKAVSMLSGHPNIAGIKNSSENIRQTIEFISLSNENFTVLAGTASILFSSLTAGAGGGIVALANILPDLCIGIMNLINSKQFDEALSIQKKIIPINSAVTSLYGVAGLKAAMDLSGYFGGETRSPLVVTGNEVKVILENLLKISTQKS